MNPQELEMWKKGVSEHLDLVDQVINERVSLKTLFKEHLKEFFDFNEIDFSRNFDVITLKWEKDANPIIKSNISQLGMDWEITTGRDDSAFSVVEVIVYPFGIPMEDKGD